MTPSVRVSVITPVYNGAGTLQRAHDSVRAQSHVDWEHVLVDDGSTDDTPRLLADLAAADRRVVTIRKENGGPGSALNAGLAQASGEVIAFLDADDEYLSHHVSARLEHFSENPGIDGIWGGFEVIAERVEDTLVPDVERGPGHFISITECRLQGTIFVKRRVIERVKFREERSIWYQDYHFVEDAAKLFRIGRFRLPTYRYYRNSGASLVDRAKAAWAS